MGKDQVRRIWCHEELGVPHEQRPRGRLWLNDGLIDEYTRECLAIRLARRPGSYEVVEALADVRLWRGNLENIRSDIDRPRYF